MPTMNISLTPELVKLVKAKVKSGMYNNASEFVRETLRAQAEVQEYLYEIKLARLKKAIAIGMDQIQAGKASPMSRKQMHAKVDARLRK